MEIWLDSIDISLIEMVDHLGFLTGVTTNPTLLSKLEMLPEEFIENLLKVHRGKIAIQIVSQEEQDMLDMARKIHYFHSNLVVKIPVTPEGIRVISQLVKEKIPTIATAVFSAQQFLQAALLGSDYVAPYLGRMQQHGIDAETEIIKMQTIIEQQNFKTKILAAAIKNVNQILFCASQGIKAITLSENIFTEFMKTHSLTLLALEQFDLDWRKSSFVGISELLN